MSEVGSAIDDRYSATPHTASFADAVLTFGGTPRVAADIVPLLAGSRVVGPAHPVVHRGSVDAILEALETVPQGAVLVVDDGGRRDRACVGDLITLEALTAGVKAMVIWGCHRDTRQIVDLGLPVYSLGACPTGPIRGDSLDAARNRTQQAMVSGLPGSSRDVVVADDDGVILVADEDYDRLMGEAVRIERLEQDQAREMRHGRSLREQVRFGAYLERRRRDPSFTFRDHLATVARTVER